MFARALTPNKHPLNCWKIPMRTQFCFLILAVGMAAIPSSGLSFEVPSPNSDPRNVESFGTTRDGSPVEQFTIGNDQLTAQVITYGATLTALRVPDRAGNWDDVVLGWDDTQGYESSDNQYFGCTTGRVCNRIAKGRFQLDGVVYQLAVNDGPNHLHGGVERSLDKVVWKAHPVLNERGQGVEFTYTSPDGEEGYPGTLQLKVTYFVPKNRAVLRIDYWATTDKKTPVNLTNHAYFNLSGAGQPSIHGHLLKINADHYTPVDETLIPTGKIVSVADSALDFRNPTAIGQRIEVLMETPTKGYDHNFVLNPPPEGKKLRQAAVLTDPKSGRRMRVATTQPGLQFYSGNFLMGQTGKAGKSYTHQSALCLETQHFPDSVNQPDFPSIILKPAEEFQSRTVFSFSISDN
jgi:aldose 1-epimerase